MTLHINNLIEHVNKTRPFVGTADSNGCDHKGRVNFLRNFRDVHVARSKILGTDTKLLYGVILEEEGIKYLSVWDYNPKTSDQRHKIELLRSYGKPVSRLSLPKGFLNQGEEIIFVGVEDHFEIYKKRDWKG
jgi:hypothetical protein